MANYQRRDPSTRRDRDQDWNDRGRQRESQRAEGEERFGRSELEGEYGEWDYDRQVEERASSRPSGEQGYERERGQGRAGEWGERSSSRGMASSTEREGRWGQEGNGGSRDRWSSEGRYGREDELGQGGRQRGELSFGGRDPSWRYGGSAYEPYYRSGRAGSEGEGRSGRSEDWRSADRGLDFGGRGGGFGSNVGYGSNYGRSSSSSSGGMQQRYGQEGSRGQHAGKGPKDFKRSDERLCEEVCEHLMADPDIDASEISVTVKDGEVTLEGSVENRQSKRDAEDCAEHVLGVRQVNNRLRIAAAGSRSSSTKGAYEMTSPRGGQQQQGGTSGESSAQQSGSEDARSSSRTPGKPETV